eukprot:6639042-Karenia_brevis.AAC.2
MKLVNLDIIVRFLICPLTCLRPPRRIAQQSFVSHYTCTSNNTRFTLEMRFGAANIALPSRDDDAD